MTDPNQVPGLSKLECVRLNHRAGASLLRRRAVCALQVAALQRVVISYCVWKTIVSYLSHKFNGDPIPAI